MNGGSVTRESSHQPLSAPGEILLLVITLPTAWLCQEQVRQVAFQGASPDSIGSRELAIEKPPGARSLGRIRSTGG
jgi:hypothetical protein